MLHSTKGIVLRTVKYGETSLIVTIYTELFGLQSYIVNGARTSKKTNNKANLFQPATLLDLVVYHTPHKNLQHIKEVKIATLYKQIPFSMIKNCIAVYMVELISKCIVEQENNPDLYYFFEEAFMYVDTEHEKHLANYPIFFTLQMCNYLGFAITSNYNETNNLFDLQNGFFCEQDKLHHTNFLQETPSLHLHTLNQMSYEGVKNYALNHEQRIDILIALLQYLKWHIPHMQTLKSVEVLQQLLG